ncbi:hypothetical protein EDC04DRAFT_2896555 [Pisolithus marmoratus]|nr:hypothetical protein EDC04DRAFT_2896555 [Pisolithus marmoratus]
MSTSIFTDKFSDDNHLQDSANAWRVRDVLIDSIPDHNTQEPALQVDEPPPPPMVIPKKGGQPLKKVLPASKEGNSAALELQEPPKPMSIMYYLALFSESEMKKTLQWDFEWDTVKVQFLMKITQTYDFMWNIPCQQSSQMQLQMDNDYKFLIAHALKMKEPAVNVKIEVRVAKKGKKNDSGTEHNMSDNSSNSDSDTSRDVKCVKKKSKKKSKDNRKNKEMMLNKDIEEKIKLLCNCWECLKVACMSGAVHCFIHLESPEHFALSHNHFVIWAAAWQHGPQFADLERPLNHVKFNDFCIGQAIDSVPLLQWHMAECSQAISTALIINFNLPPKLFNALCPPAAKPASPV